jgi:actin-related protein
MIAKKQLDDLQRAELAHQQAAEALRSLLKRHHADAKIILTKEKEQKKKLQELQQAKLEQEEQEQARLDAKEQARLEEQIAKEKQLHQLQEKQEQERKALLEKQHAQDAAEAKKLEYVVKAKSLVADLVQLRASVEPFESSKAVGKRRLQMKKVVKGKVNTLSTDPSKVQAVAMEVIQVIVDAKAEDEQMKKNPQATPEMSMGSRYLIDLLASTAMVRVQAEGFNGPRGDGFPLAHMLALVGHQANELIPLLLAHVYTVCPTAIPALPKRVQDETEEQLMESLGMIRTKEGEFETFARFLARTEVSSCSCVCRDAIYVIVAWLIVGVVSPYDFAGHYFHCGQHNGVKTIGPYHVWWTQGCY